MKQYVMKKWTMGTTPVRFGGGMYLPVYYPDIAGYGKTRRILWLSMN